MTEAQWLACADPEPMLRWVFNKVSERQWRLFGIACCRRIWHFLEDGRSRAAVVAAEEIVEDRLTSAYLGSLLRSAEQAALEYHNKLLSRPISARWSLSLPPMGAVHAASWMARPTAKPVDGEGGIIGCHTYAQLAHEEDEGTREYEQRRQTDDMRDIFGNPFRPVAVDPSWLTSTVVALAGGIYAERAFDRLPILADALQDAGCDSDDILTHCRGDGPHVRGCWAVDLILGKS